MKRTTHVGDRFFTNFGLSFFFFFFFFFFFYTHPRIQLSKNRIDFVNCRFFSPDLVTLLAWRICFEGVEETKQFTHLSFQSSFYLLFLFLSIKVYSYLLTKRTFLFCVYVAAIKKFLSRKLQNSRIRSIFQKSVFGLSQLWKINVRNNFVSSLTKFFCKK